MFALYAAALLQALTYAHATATTSSDNEYIGQLLADEVSAIKEVCFEQKLSIKDMDDKCTTTIDMTNLVENHDLLLKAAQSKYEYETDPNWQLLKVDKNDSFASLYRLSFDELQGLLQKDPVLSNQVLQAFVKDAIKKRSSCHVGPVMLCRYFEHLNGYGSEQITMGSVPNEILNACKAIVDEKDDGAQFSATEEIIKDFIKGFILNPAAYKGIKVNNLIELAAVEAVKKEGGTGLSEVKRYRPFFDIVVQARTKQCPHDSAIGRWLSSATPTTTSDATKQMLDRRDRAIERLRTFQQPRVQEEKFAPHVVEGNQQPVPKKTTWKEGISPSRRPQVAQDQKEDKTAAKHENQIATPGKASKLYKKVTFEDAAKSTPEESKSIPLRKAKSQNRREVKNSKLTRPAIHSNPKSKQ